MRNNGQRNEFEATAGKLIDAAIVVVLAVSGVVAVRAVSEQHRFDPLMTTLAELLRVDGASKVALPWSYRRGVPALLAEKTQPKLYEPASVSVQGLARGGVRYVLTIDEATGVIPERAIAGRRPLEGASLIELDSARALNVPLKVGQVIRWFDGRPYRYRPLRDSLVIEDGQSIEYEAVLAAGVYELTVEAFARNGGTLRVVVDAPGTEPTTTKLEAVVFRPFVQRIELPNGPRSVRVVLQPSVAEGRHAARCFVHMVQLERKS